MTKVLVRNGRFATYDGKVVKVEAAAISGSPIVDDSLDNTTQYRQMNATTAAYIAELYQRAVDSRRPRH